MDKPQSTELLFEMSHLGRRCHRLPACDVPMVPLEKLEEEIHGILATTERVCAVAAIPDEKRGERLVVLHTPLQGLDVRDLCKRLGDRGLPNLWLPGERDFFQVAELPILGSGKVNLQQVKEMALGCVNGAK